MTAETRRHLDLILIWMQSTKVQLNVSFQVNEAHFLSTALAKQMESFPNFFTVASSSAIFSFPFQFIFTSKMPDMCEHSQRKI